MEFNDIQDPINHSKQGSFYKQGNDLMLMQRQENKLMWERPHFQQDRSKPDYQPGRMSYDMLRIRSEETTGYGKRRQTETRKFKHEFPDRIKEMQLRVKQEEEERALAQKGPKLRMRWWWKKTAVELRDPLKMLRMNNFTFKPEELMNAKDIVFLQLTGCRMGDEAMSWVSAFMQQSYTLKRISLQANQLTAEGCNELFLGLRTSKTLMEFDISMNPIGDDGCATICNALSENSRWSKVYSVNMSCCKLGPSSGFHLSRLIRDFKPLQSLLIWRNNLGCLTPTKVSGVSSILEELRASTSMKLINLTCNAIMDSDVSLHANTREVEMRRHSTLEIEKKQLQHRIEDLQKLIKVKRREAVWDDQRVEIAGMEKGLNETKSKLRVAASLEARSRTKAQKEEVAYQERVKNSCNGEELIINKTRPRLVLVGNHSIRRTTLSRLGAFYDVSDTPDANEFVHRRRRFDNIVHSRRQIGEEYDGPRDVDAYDDHNVFKWDQSFDPKSDHARRTIVLEWREEHRVKALNAVAVKFDKFAMKGPAGDVPLGKDGKPLKMVAGGVGVSSGVGDNLRDEKAGDRLAEIAKRKEAIKIKQEAAAATVIVKPTKVTVEQEVVTEVVRVGKDGKVKSTDIVSGNVTEAEFAKAKAKQQKNADDFASSDSEGETLPAPRTATTGDEQTDEGEGEGEKDDQNEEEGFDFDAYEDGGGDESDILALLMGTTSGGLDLEATVTVLTPAERNEQRMAEHKAKLEQKLQLTPRAEAPAALVVASSQAITDQLGGSVTLNQSGGGGGGSESGMSSNVSTPLNSPRPTSETDQSVLQVVKGEFGDQLDASTGSSVHASPPPVPIIPNLSGSSAVSKETEAVMQCIGTIDTIKSKVKTLSEKGSPSDDDLAMLEKEKVHLANAKTEATKRIGSFTTAAIIGPSQLSVAWDFIDALIRDTDIPTGNAELLAAILLKVATDYPTLIEERGLAAMAAADSSISYLKLLLAVPQLRLDVVDVVSSCFFNQTARIPLSLLILSQPSSVVDLAPAVEDLSFMWQEFFEDCASKKRSIPREDRAGRMELLTIMMNNNTWGFEPVDIEAEGSDGQSILFRACAEGDLPLMELLLANTSSGSPLKEPNAARGAGMTIFHAAVVGNDVAVVQLLLDKVGPELDVQATSDNGNAMDLATLLGRDPAIVALLKAKGIKPTGKAPKVAPRKAVGKKAPSKAAPKKPTVAPGKKTAGPASPAKRKSVAVAEKKKSVSGPARPGSQQIKKKSL